MKKGKRAAALLLSFALFINSCNVVMANNSVSLSENTVVQSQEICAESSETVSQNSQLVENETVSENSQGPGMSTEEKDIMTEQDIESLETEVLDRGQASESPVSIGVNKTIVDTLSSGAGLWKTEKYYQFTIPQDGVIQITFSHELYESSVPGWTISLYDMSQSPNSFYNFQSTDGYTETATSVQIGLRKGTYQICVSTRGADEDTQFSMMVGYAASGSWEKEINDGWLQASSINPNQVYYGSLHGSKDEDTYIFHATADGVFQFLFEHPLYEGEDTAWELELYNHKQEKIYNFEASNGYTMSKSSAQIGLPAGTYYIKIKNYRGNCWNLTYTMNAMFQPSYNWEKELNEGWLSATPSAINTNICGSSASTKDIDYYSFYNDESRLVNIVFEHPLYEGYEHAWDITLYDQNQREILDMQSSGPMIGRTNSADVYLAKGTYYVKVEVFSSFYYEDFTYTLKFHTQPKVGTEVQIGNLKYKVMKNGFDGYVQCTGPKNKNITSATIKIR